MFKLIQRGQVFADCHGWPVIVAGSDAKVVRYWRQGADQHSKHRPL